MLRRWLGAREWRLEHCQQPLHVAEGSELLCTTPSFTRRLEKLRKQGCHRRSFVHKDADVALGFAEGERPLKRDKCSARFPPRVQCERSEDEDLDRAAHPCPTLCRPKQPIDQAQGVVEVGTLRVVSSPGDEHTCQGQVFHLTRIAGFVDVQTIRIDPSDSLW